MHLNLETIAIESKTSIMFLSRFMDSLVMQRWNKQTKCKVLTHAQHDDI